MPPYDMSTECAHLGCPSPSCYCGCHGGKEYVPVQGWLPAAQAQQERGAYLDMDAAIERAYEHEGDV